MATYDEYNPIRLVRNPEDSNDEGVYVPTPSAYTFKIEDISSADAGRTEDAKMHKNRVGQVVGIELSWKNIKTEVVSEILNIFDPEYLIITYLSAKTGTYETDEFYVGNRTAPMYNSRKGLWTNVSFNLIQRDG